MRRGAAVTGVALTLVAGGCGAAGGGRSARAHEAVAPPVAAHGLVALTAYDSCGQLLSQVRAQALAEVGPEGLSAATGGLGNAGGGPVAGVANLPAAASEAAGGTGGPAAPVPAGTAGGAGTAATGAEAPATPGFSTTNDQEAGVDEPDLAKTDGTLLVAIRQGSAGIQVADTGASPRLRGFLGLGSLGAPTGLFLVGGQAVVLLDGAAASSAGATPGSAGGSSSAGSSGGSSSAAGAVPVPSDVTPLDASPASTVVAVVSLADPDHPTLARSFTIQGREVDARLVGGHVEVVVTSSPDLPLVVPSTGAPGAARDALAVNQAVIRSSGVGAWLPSVTSARGGATSAPSAPSCTTTMHPAAATGLDTVSVVPIDPSAPEAGPPVTVVGDASTVYAGTDSLYVATSTSSAPTSSAPVSSTQTSTVIHDFDLSDPSAPRYVGSGSVSGSLIGQYALSEYQGLLRVATTVGMPAPAPLDGPAPTTASDNRVTVLQASGGALVPVGSVGGLGAGEKIYAVRFMGPLAYVVTFRQTDPLFVVDLSDPLHPKAAGQLALDGYSSFLEPIAGDLLLGVGQSVDPDLRTDGLQLSLFDVADPDHPTLVSKLVYAGASSAAQNDPHALLYWAPSGLVVLPVDQYGDVVPQATPPLADTAVPSASPAPATPSTPFEGAIAFRVGPGTLAEAGRVTQPVTSPSSDPGPSSPGGVTPANEALGVPASGGTAGGGSGGGTGGSTGGALEPAASMPAMVAPAAGPGIERALVVGTMLYTVSESGILVSDLGSFSTLAWMPYA